MILSSVIEVNTHNYSYKLYVKSLSGLQDKSLLFMEPTFYISYQKKKIVKEPFPLDWNLNLPRDTVTE